jgi:hemin uptake protein HemP
MPASDRQTELSLRGRTAAPAADDAFREEDTMHQANQSPPPAARGAFRGRPPRAPSVRRIGSRELMGPTGQIIIRHGGDDYHLRVTSKGKLILTK